MFKVPNEHRIKDVGPWSSNDSDGNNGAFKFLLRRKKCLVIASDGMGWEHVSISLPKENRCPTWEEMCLIKDMFWDEEDCVVQYHPPKSDYVNQHPFTLHLFRPTEQVLPQPPSIMIGFK